MLFKWGQQRIPTAVKSGPTIDTLQGTNSLVTAQRGSTKRSSSSLASIHPVPLSPGHESPATGCKFTSVFSNWWRDESDARKIAHVCLKVVDLMLQEFTLYQILEAGFPIPLVVACTLMVVWNAIAAVGLMYSPAPPSQIGEALVDAISDFLVSVVFPILALTYCLANFDFDRATQRLAADLFPSWSFQNAARPSTAPWASSISSARCRKV
ncbi:hypothetical protein PF004_g1235 [Phytophthora fragariae]|nr:hypothetical protein PF004_g1235 [Phytophthora fragariae]